MARAGLLVPPGFVLLTPAYRAFVEANGLQAEIERTAAQATAEDPESVEAASAAIRARFDRGAIPPEVARATIAAYERLGRPRVAVRSSATAEDLPGASFAGQQESYLNVEGDDRLLEAVRRCWSSLWTGRAIAYRLRQRISPADVALAVVVQRQVEADAAGILFTANPVNGRRDQMVIDGAWGLGEAVVSGQVTPDRWVADWETGAVLEAHPGRKLVMTVRQDGATATAPVPDHLQEQPVLSPDQVTALADIGRRVASHFGSPQDIEWALADGRFHVVQSRPITSLFPLPRPEPRPGAGLRVYMSFNILQGIVEPFTPMGISVFRNLGRGPATLFGFARPNAEGPAAFKVAAGRVYLDVTDALTHPRIRPAILRIPAILDRQIGDVLRALVERDGELATVAGRVPVRPPLGLLLRLAPRLLAALLAPHAARRRALAGAEELFQRLRRQADGLATIEARRRFVAEKPPAQFASLMPRLFGPIGVGFAARFLAERKLRDWLGDAPELQAVTRSLPYNPTTEMDLALWRLSRRLKAEGAEPSADHPGVKAFLEDYGHRAVREIDVGMPRWSDDPTHVLNVLRTYLTHPEDADAEAHFRKGMDEADRAAQALVARVRERKGLLRAWLARLLLSRVRALGGLREYPKFFWVRVLALCRRVLAQAGAQLVDAGRLDVPEDVFFLDLADLGSDHDLRARAATNRTEYERELLRRSIPRVITSRGETFYAAPAAAAGGIAGTPASPGVFEGRVRVIHDPRGAKLEPGEILVAPGTDPAWTPLFLTAGALVMEIGGTMSHGSVVAHEYGIPAVVGVWGATERLRTGQRVRVDGESGVVTPLD